MQRDFEIPSPFRGVSDGVGTRSSESRWSYQPARSPTKSKAPPRFVPAVFGQPSELQVESNARTGGLLLTLEGLGWPKNPTLALGPHSPLFVPETNLGALQPLKQRLPVASLKAREDEWWLEPGGVFFLNGQVVDGPISLAAGDALEFEPPVGAPSAWTVAFEGEPSPLFWAPLLTAIVHGAVTAHAASDGTLKVTLRAGRHSLRLDAAAWLARAVTLGKSISHLELHLEPHSTPSVIEALRDHARHAPFEVSLVADAATFHPTSTEHLNKARAPLRGWSTLKTEDLIDEKPAAPRERRTTSPHVQFPAEAWRTAPLEHDGEDWVLSLPQETWRWVELHDGLHERLVDGTIAKYPTSFFRPVLPTRERWSRRHFGFRLLPSASAFFEGRRLVPEGTLSPELLGVFADQLIAEGDCAGPLLNDVILSTATSQRSLDALLEPWSRLGGTAIPARRALSGVHVCGFYETLWRDFEKDLPILFTHPMLQRLRHVVLDGRGADDAWCGAARIELIVEAARPFLDGPIQVDLKGQPLRAWR